MDLDQAVPQDEKLSLAHKFYLLSLPDALAPNKPGIKDEIMASVEKHSMAECYKHFAGLDKSPLGPCDTVLVERLATANATKLAELEAKITDMEENMGESEVRDARLEKVEQRSSFSFSGHPIPVVLATLCFLWRC